ncbi:MAG TPA: hypothetical protein VHI72_05900 [Hyphomicrobiaceae bacterium]|nr:hypothetical protein [Hyphomicrobiaceae bacterium]
MTIFTRNGHDWTDRFPRLVAELVALPTCIIDAELVATGATGVADFAMFRRRVSKRQEDDFALWAFDLLYARGRDIRGMPYVERKEKLASLVARRHWSGEPLRVLRRRRPAPGGMWNARPRRHRLQAE